MYVFFFTDIFIIKLFNCLTYSSCSETVYVLLFLLKCSIFRPFGSVTKYLVIDLSVLK